MSWVIRYGAVSLLLVAVFALGTAAAEKYVGHGRYVGVINDVQVDAGITIIGDTQTGFTTARLTDVADQEYRVLAPYLASGFCRFVAREMGAAVNLATVTQGSPLLVRTVTDWEGGPLFPPPGPLEHGIWIDPKDDEVEFIEGEPHQVVALMGGNPIGRVPALPPGDVRVHYFDWSERWVQVAPGFIHATIEDRAYSVDGEIRHTRWTTSLNYDPRAGSLATDQIRETFGAKTVYDPARGEMYIEMTSTVRPAEGGSIPVTPVLDPGQEPNGCPRYTPLLAAGDARVGLNARRGQVFLSALGFYAAWDHTPGLTEGDLLFSFWIYQESNGQEGLQRGDEYCRHGGGEDPDTILF